MTEHRPVLTLFITLCFKQRLTAHHHSDLMQKKQNTTQYTITVPPTPAQEARDPLALLEPQEEHRDLIIDSSTPNTSHLWQHRRVIGTCTLVACAGFIFGYDTGTIGGILQLDSAREVLGTLNDEGDYEIGTVIHGLIISMYHVGCIIGGFTIVRLADYLGRKRPIQIAMTCYIVGILIQVTTVKTHKWYQFMIGRMVTGLCIGSAGVLSPMLISETAPMTIRGSLTSLYQLLVTFGILLGSIVIYASKASLWGNAPWMVTLLLGMGAACCVFLGIFFTPESPRWLVSTGREEKARRALRQAGDSDIDGTVHMLKTKLALEESATQVGFVEMIRNKQNFKRLVIGMALMLFQQMSGVDYFMYFGTQLFSSVGMSDSYVTLIILSLVNHAGSWIGVVTVERYGRRPSLLMGAFLEFICLAIYSAVGSTLVVIDGSVEQNKIPGTVMIVFTCIFILVFSVTWSACVNVVCAEVFPYQIRSKAFGLSIAFNWGSNFFIAFCTPIITAKIHYLFGFVFTGFVFASFWFVLLMVPETRGVSLEQMDTLFDEKESLELNANAYP